MNAAALLWLSVISTGVASTLATWKFLNICLHRFNLTNATSALAVRTVAARTKLPLQAWTQYAAPVIGFFFAFKLAWDDRWILALCLVFTGLILMEPIRTWMQACRIHDSTPVMDLALICVQCHSNKAVLQTLDEAGTILDHSKVLEIVRDALAFFYNGATEGEALQQLLSENTNSNWALLIWTLLEQRHSGESTKLRDKFSELMQGRLELHKRVRSAHELTRRSLGIALILCAGLSAYLTISPISSFYASSVQGQVISGIVLFILVWATCIWSAQVQTLQRILE